VEIRRAIFITIKNTIMKQEKFEHLAYLYRKLEIDEERYKSVFNISVRTSHYNNFLIIASKKDNEDKNETVISDEVFEAILKELLRHLGSRIESIKQEITKEL
jgi:hypothetical protein